MLMMKIVYKMPEDDQEYNCNIVGQSPEEVARYLVEFHGCEELPYFRCIGRSEIHAVMPSIEKGMYLKVQRSIDSAKQV